MNKTKRCTKCVVWKGENEFYKDKRHKDGLQSWCKDCHKEYAKERRQTKEYKEYYKEYSIKYNKTDKQKEYRNTDKYKEYQRKYQKEYRKTHKEDSREYYKEYTKTDKQKKKRNKRLKKKRDTDLKFRLDGIMATTISTALRGKKAGRKWEELVGYSVEDLMIHLESKFEPWMNWDNYGVYEEGKFKWHIDHIKPKSLFNYTYPEDEEFKECWALSNLQPLEAIENIKKGNKYKLCL